MRPSLHCASGWPCSAAYCSEFSALAVSPDFSNIVPERNASIAEVGEAAANRSLDFEPSNATAGTASRAAPISAAPRKVSTVRITLFLGRAARMGHRAFDGRPDLFGGFSQIPGCARWVLPGLPSLSALRQFHVGQLHIQNSAHGIDLNDVAVTDKPDRTAHRGFGPDMAD